MSEPFFPALACMCGNFRRTSRALTQLYENAIRPLGLRASQFSILQVLFHAGEVSQQQLGEMLAMDSTSLTRTLAIMRRRRWILVRSGEDRRKRLLRLADAGKCQLKAVLPVWEKTQSRLRRQLGAKTWNELLLLTHRIARLVTTQGGSL